MTTGRINQVSIQNATTPEGAERFELLSTELTIKVNFYQSEDREKLNSSFTMQLSLENVPISDVRRNTDRLPNPNLIKQNNSKIALPVDAKSEYTESTNTNSQNSLRKAETFQFEFKNRDGRNSN